MNIINWLLITIEELKFVIKTANEVKENAFLEFFFAIPNLQFLLSLPCKVEKVLFWGKNFRTGDFDGFTRFGVS